MVTNIFFASVLLWTALIMVLLLNRMMYPMCWAAADILINNSVFPEHLGLVNGLAMTFSFFARAVGPLAAGSIFSWCGRSNDEGCICWSLSRYISFSDSVSLNYYRFFLRSISTGVDFGFPMTHHLVFFVIDLTMIVCLVIGVFTPRSLDKQPETWIRPHGEAEIASPAVAGAAAAAEAGVSASHYGSALG